MSFKKRLNSLLLIFLLLYIFQLIIVKANNDDVTKLVSCMSIISQKYKGQTPESKTYSSMLLKCFITISEETKKEILVGMQQGMDDIEPEEIEKLTDVTTLNEIPQEQLKENSIQLENAIAELKKIQENYRNGKQTKAKDTNYEEDEEFRKTHPSRGNSLGAFMRKMTGTLKAINNMGNYVIGIIVIYFIYIMLGKCLEKKKVGKYKEKEKDNKNKDKKNKKKNE